MKRIYTLADRDTKAIIGEPTFERGVARAQKQDLKNKGLDPIILSSKLDKQQARIIR
jgi:hypothetical protein